MGKVFRAALENAKTNIKQTIYSFVGNVQSATTNDATKTMVVNNQTDYNGSTATIDEDTGATKIGNFFSKVFNFIENTLVPGFEEFVTLAFGAVETILSIFGFDTENATTDIGEDNVTDLGESIDGEQYTTDSGDGNTTDIGDDNVPDTSDEGSEYGGEETDTGTGGTNTGGSGSGSGGATDDLSGYSSGSSDDSGSSGSSGSSGGSSGDSGSSGTGGGSSGDSGGSSGTGGGSSGDSGGSSGTSGGFSSDSGGSSGTSGGFSSDSGGSSENSGGSSGGGTGTTGSMGETTSSMALDSSPAKKPVETEVKIPSERTYYDEVPLSESDQDIIYECANKYGLDPSLVYAVIETESSFNKNIGVNDSNCAGLMQMNLTYSEPYGVTSENYSDVYTNVNGGCMLLAEKYKKYGDWNLALMAYNLGDSAANANIDNGNYSNNYSRTVLSRIDKYQ